MLNPEASLQNILNPELSQTITTLARQEGQTMLEWIERILREAIQIHSRPQSYEHQVLEALTTLERLKQQHAKYLAEHGQPLNIDTVAILDQLRDERDAELLACRHYRRD